MKAQGRSAPIAGMGWQVLVLVLLLALVIRVSLFNGAFGSDDNVYYDRALDVANGHWSSASYNGALRYGFNLPAGLLAAAFGPSLWVVNLWPLLCSLIEVGMVYAFAQALGGRRLAVSAALLLACAPLHVSVATRIHADPVVASFLTSGVVLTYFGWRDRRPDLLLAAGLALGGVFWAKELAAVTYFALLPLLWFFRGRWRDLAIVIGGVLLMLVLHGVLMTAIAGHPLHLVRTVLMAVQRNFVQGGDGEDAASYYLRYLFVDVRHTGLLGWLGALGSALMLVSRRREHGAVATDGRAEDGARGFFLVWLLGLLLVLSLFPVSLSPLRLTLKQSNYISLFLAPLAIAAACTLQALPQRLGQVLLAMACLLGLTLAALQQADYRAFTANGKAAALWSEQHADVQLLGSKSNANVAALWLRAQRGGADLKPVRALVAWPPTDTQPGPVAAPELRAPIRRMYVIYEPLTLAWPGSRPPLGQPLSCWIPAFVLNPIDLGLGNRFAGQVADLIRLLGVGPAERAATLFDRLARPEPATVYAVTGNDPWCGARPPALGARP
jgi:4-amino-4-deoxy-L-arabinose transferase-like glycosyltransferase